MTPLGFHVTFRLENDRNLADTPWGRRTFASVVLEVARPFPLLACRWADTHGHLVAAGDRASAGECARRLEIALSLAMEPGAAFTAAKFKAVEDAAHLRAAFLYVLGKDRQHGIESDPGHDASNLPDLLGARLLGAWTIPNVRKHLPRVHRRGILEAAGLEDPEQAVLTLDGLADAAAAAVGCAELAGREATVVAARRAAAHVARAEGGTAIGAALGVSDRSVRRLLSEEPDPALVRAVRLQLALRGVGGR